MWGRRLNSTFVLLESKIFSTSKTQENKFFYKKSCQCKVKKKKIHNLKINK
jgi:hypothetical protein